MSVLVSPAPTKLTLITDLYSKTSNSFSPKSDSTNSTGSPQPIFEDYGSSGQQASGQQEGFIIDVKPKRKQFKSREEKIAFVSQYKMKFKTEMCKNFELRGWCKYGNTCSFAHGKDELQGKVHLHEKYKTRPCQQFHQDGYCSYGIRCQYLHKNALGPNIFYEPSTEKAWNAERNNYGYDLLDEIWRMSSSNIRVEKILEKIPPKKRLAVFGEITQRSTDL